MVSNFKSLWARISAKSSFSSKGLLLALSTFTLVGFQNCTGGNFKLSSEVSGSSFCSASPGDAACIQDNNATCRFNGIAVPEGSTLTAYLASTVSAGSTCTSQLRTCTNGTLSGNYAFATCAVGAPAACLFDGRSLASGSTVTAYLAASPAAGQTCQTQQRTCTNGVLSGSFSYASCTAQAYASCLFNGQTVAHGSTVVAYPTSSVAAGSQCQPQNRTCYNGSLSGSGSFASCQIAASASCMFNGQTIASGQSVTAYATSSVPAGQTCQPVTRTCSNGTLSGSAQMASCSVAAPAACLFQGQTIASGGSIARYLQTDVDVGQTCATENRVCNNGSLSGSATADSCVVHTGTRLSTLVTSPGVDVVIPAGTKYEIDQTQNIGLLQVQGQLVCPPVGNYTLNVQGIQVYGAGALFQCGTQASRFQGTLNIRLNGGKQIMQSERSFVAFNQGTIQFGGAYRNVNWFKLAQTANAGSQTITMTGGEGWAAGDHIAIASTSFDPHESEEAVIASVSNAGKTINLVSPLQYRHWGGVQTMTSPRRSWAIDESAEVINLTRNIRIEAPGDGPSLDYQGGHLMVMKTAFAYVDAIELVHMGQMGVMARYPFHWHRAGDVSGQFIVDSSIHDSFQRCVTVHGTNNAVVQNNVCFEHFGHGYFLEDGNETGNSILNNVGMLTKAPPRGRHLLESDLDRSQLPRWAGPATFWISNPSNNVSGNVSAGSEGSGYWNSFAEQINCDATQCRAVLDGTGNVFPSKAAYGTFNDNVSHSALVGMSWDGAETGALTNNPRNPNDRQVTAVHYTPPSTPIVNRNAVMKNAMAGIYFRGQPFVFNEMIFADNGYASWLAYNQTVQNSAIVGFSANHTDADYPAMQSRGTDLNIISGIWIYDGPLELKNVDFLGFPASEVRWNNMDVTPTPFRVVGGANRTTNSVQGLTFTPEPRRRLLLNNDGWLDSTFVVGIRDVDGSLGGSANKVLVIDDAYNTHSSCVSLPNTRALRCDYQTSNMYFPVMNIPFSLRRNDGASSRYLSDIRPENYFNKVGLVPGYEYTLRYGTDIANGTMVPFFYQGEGMSLLSPVIRMADVGTGCTIANATRVSSIDQVRAANAAVFFQSGQDVYFRMQTNSWYSAAPGVIGSAGYGITCTGHPSVDQLLSPLVFDVYAYKVLNADLRNLSDDVARGHWLNYGAAEGRQAHPTFAVKDYLALNKDVSDSVAGNPVGAIRHYVANGWNEKRVGRTWLSPLVYDEGWYKSYNYDLAYMTDVAARDHWITSGINEGRQALNTFWSKTYLARYSDLSASLGATNYSGAIEQYVKTGKAEGRSGQ